MLSYDTLKPNLSSTENEVSDSERLKTVSDIRAEINESLSNPISGTTVTRRLREIGLYGQSNNENEYSCRMNSNLKYSVLNDECFAIDKTANATNLSVFSQL